MARYTLTADQLDNIQYQAEDFGIESFYPHYSGRGMYGATCVGITHTNDATAVAAFLYFLAEELEEQFIDLLAELGGGSQDNMGLSTITYWRNLTVEGDEKAEEDEA